MHEKNRETVDANPELLSNPEETLESQQTKENLPKINVCEFCGRSFGSIGDLELHVKVHTHEKPFECLVCFTAFATRSAMRIHEKIHTGIDFET